jgi:hypothetical protein
MIRRIAGIGVAWSALWIGAAGLLTFVLSIVDPPSVDPGEPAMAVLVFGSMGLLSGLAFGALLWMAGYRATFDVSFGRALAWGTLASAIAQMPYLGHGDQGLTANLQVAALLAVVGGVIAMVWLGLARGWKRWRGAAATQTS